MGKDPIQTLIESKYEQKPFINVQKSAISSIQTLSTIYYSILEAFKSQSDENQHLKQQITKMQNEIKDASKQMDKSAKSMKDTINFVHAHIQKQNEDVQTRINSMKSEMYTNIEKAETTQKEIFQKMKITEERIGQKTSDLDEITNTINDRMNSMVSDHQSLQSGILQTAASVTDNFNKIYSDIQKARNDASSSLDKLSEKFQLLRFDVDQVTSKKADIEDLKWKVGVDEYKKFKKYVETINDTLRFEKNQNTANLDAISTKNAVDFSNLRVEIEQINVNNQESIQMIDDKHRIEFDAMQNEMERLQTKLYESGGSENMMSMISMLRDNMKTMADVILEEPMTKTLNNNCLACGKAFKPKMSFDFDTKSMGGGFNPKTPRSLSMTSAFRENVKEDGPKVKRMKDQIKKSRKRSASMQCDSEKFKRLSLNNNGYHVLSEYEMKQFWMSQMSNMHCVSESGSVFFLIKSLSDKLRSNSIDTTSNHNIVKSEPLKSKANIVNNNEEMKKEEKKTDDDKPIDWELILFYKNEKEKEKDQNAEKKEESDVEYIYDKEIDEFVSNTPIIMTPLQSSCIGFNTPISTIDPDKDKMLSPNHGWWVSQEYEDEDLDSGYSAEDDDNNNDIDNST